MESIINVMKRRSIYHLYLDEDKTYNSKFKDIKIQYIDMGIAMYHFESAAKELGLNGAWNLTKPAFESGGPVYVASWTATK
jgi:hypothetical protein